MSELKEYTILVKSKGKREADDYESHQFITHLETRGITPLDAIDRYFTLNEASRYYDKELAVIGNEGRTIYGPFIVRKEKFTVNYITKDGKEV